MSPRTGLAAATAVPALSARALLDARYTPAFRGRLYCLLADGALHVHDTRAENGASRVVGTATSVTFSQSR